MDFLLWAAGNVVLPLLPLIFAYFGLRVIGQPRTVAALFGDGGVLFYATSLAAAVLLDVWKDRIATVSKVSIPVATVVFLVAGFFTLLSAGLFAFMTLARVQPGARYDIMELSNASWQSAAVVAILCSVFRWLTGLY